MDNTTVIWITVAALAVASVIVALIVSRRHARLRSLELQRHFGPEYDRAVEAHGSAARAERELQARARRVDGIKFRELSAPDRARFSADWTRIQARFVDDPALAVSEADELINQVMRARGYPTEHFEQRVADLSVDHPDVVQHYRAARTLVAASSGQINTEDLRQAVVHYRFLFSALLDEAEPQRQLQESTA